MRHSGSGTRPPVWHHTCKLAAMQRVEEAVCCNQTPDMHVCRVSYCSWCTCSVLSWHVTPCPVMPCPVVSCPVLSCLSVSAYDTQPVVLSGMAHDVMLDTRWEAAAEALQRWLDKTY